MSINQTNNARKIFQTRCCIFNKSVIDFIQSGNVNQDPCDENNKELLNCYENNIYTNKIEIMWYKNKQ